MSICACRSRKEKAVTLGSRPLLQEAAAPAPEEPEKKKEPPRELAEPKKEDASNEVPNNGKGNKRKQAVNQKDATRINLLSCACRRRKEEAKTFRNRKELEKKEEPLPEPVESNEEATDKSLGLDNVNSIRGEFIAEVIWSQPIPYGDGNDFWDCIRRALQRDENEHDVIKTNTNHEMTFDALANLAGEELKKLFPICVRVKGEAVNELPEVAKKEASLSEFHPPLHSEDATDCVDVFSQECTRKDIINMLLKGFKFATLPDKWKHDRLVVDEAMALDPTGRVLRDIPEQDDKGNALKNDRALVMKAVRKAGTNLSFVNSECLRNDEEIVLAAVVQTVRACKYMGEELKKDIEFVKKLLGELIKYNGAVSKQSMIVCSMEPQRPKVTKYCYSIPRSWPGNLSAGLNDPEFGEGTFELPFGTDVGETIEERTVEIITSNAYAGQSNITEGIDESVIHDPEVLQLMFMVDCVAVLFNDLERKELALGSDNSPSSKPMRPHWKKLVDEWHSHHEIELRPVERLYCWPDPAIWRPIDDTPIAVADNVHFWIECVRRTNNPSLLAEAPKDMLTNEDNMLEAVRKDINLFNVMPWKLRVSETFKARCQEAFPGAFLWITLEDKRAKIPSKARDSEMGEMIAAFAAIQKKTGKQQHQVPFLQVSDGPQEPGGLQRTASAPP